MIRLINRSLKTDRKNEKRVGRVVRRYAFDILPAILTLAAGFMAVKAIYDWQRWPLFWSYREIVYSLISFGFCYWFVILRRNQQHNLLESQDLIKHDTINLTYSYTLFAAILFFTIGFYEARGALIIGFILTLGVVHLKYRYLLPLVHRLFQTRVEGKHRLILNLDTRKSDKVQNRIPGVKTITKRDLKEPPKPTIVEDISGRFEREKQADHKFEKL